MLLHLFREQRTESRRSTVNPFRSFSFFKVHLHETRIDLLNASWQPFAMPFGDHTLSDLHLDHRPLGAVLIEVVFDERTGRRMDVVPDNSRDFADEANVIGRYVLGVAIVEEDQVTPLVV